MSRRRWTGEQPTEQQLIDERRRFVEGFNSTMVKIWREKIALLGAVDTGNLYRSVMGVHVGADGRYLEISLSQSFALYGLYVDAGTGREVYKGNPGDIGRDKLRQRKEWFHKKYYGSYMTLREYMADSIGREFVAAFSRVLTQ